MATQARPGPFFVGGTGRSGTTIVGDLLGARSDVAVVPFELRFHVDRGGLLDLARGTIPVERFAWNLRQRWWERSTTPRGPRGVGVLIDAAGRRRAMDRLRRDHVADPWGACAAFMGEVLDPFAARAGAATWGEMTPPNARAADGLLRLFPDARLIHMVRDGRDVASSVVPFFWGPHDLEGALRWWADGLVEITRAIARADPERVLTLRLEELTGPAREEQYRRLVDFLGRGDEPGMRAFFAAQMSSDRAHSGRWRDGLDDAGRQAFQARYVAECRRLAEAGVDLQPVGEA